MYFRWYRGLVLSVDGHQAEVFFVDYGNTEWVGNNHVQPMDSAYMHVSVVNTCIIVRGHRRTLYKDMM